MNLKVLFYFIVLTVLANGCISEFNANLPSNDLQILVVDGCIIENTDVTFFISKSFSLNLDNIPDRNFINQANLTVIGSNGYKSQPAISQGKGAYQISVGKLDDDVQYGIQIEYDGNVYQSTLSKPIYTQDIDSVSWIQPEKADTVFFRVSTHGDSDETKYFLWNYTEIWEMTAEYYTTILFNPNDTTCTSIYPAPYYYCWKKNESDNFLIGSTEFLRENRIINNQLFRIDPTDSRFATLYSVTVNQRAITKAAYEYYQSIIKVNEEMGGLFTPQPSDLGGNITCITDPSKRITGYVETVKNTTQKRIFVYPEQITRPWIPNYCYNSAITNDSVFRYISIFDITLVDFYRMGYRPAGSAIDMKYYPTIYPEEWARLACTDCVANGGTKNKPDFWPNEHE